MSSATLCVLGPLILKTSSSDSFLSDLKLRYPNPIVALLGYIAHETNPYIDNPVEKIERKTLNTFLASQVDIKRQTAKSQHHSQAESKKKGSEEAPPSSSRARDIIFDIRKNLPNNEAFLNITRLYISLQPGLGCDIHEFHRLLAASEDVKELKAAVALYRGGFLEEVDSARLADAMRDWLLRARSFYIESFDKAYHRLILYLRSTRELAQAQQYAQDWQRLSPVYHVEASLEIIYLEAEQRGVLAALKVCEQQQHYVMHDMSLSDKEDVPEELKAVYSKLLDPLATLETVLPLERYRALDDHSPEVLTLISRDISSEAQPPQDNEESVLPDLPQELVSSLASLSHLVYKRPLITLTGADYPTRSLLSRHLYAQLKGNAFFQHGVTLITLPTTLWLEHIWQTLWQENFGSSPDLSLEIKLSQEPSAQLQQLNGVLHNQERLLILDDATITVTREDTAKHAHVQVLTQLLHHNPGLHVVINTPAALGLRYEQRFPL